MCVYTNNYVYIYIYIYTQHMDTPCTNITDVWSPLALASASAALAASFCSLTLRRLVAGSSASSRTGGT